MQLFDSLPGTGQARCTIEDPIYFAIACRMTYAADLAAMAANGKRSAEFLAGRAAATQALAAAGCPGAQGFYIGRNRFGAPLWPAGWTGSITHAGGACLAIAARSADYLAIGLDLEVDRGAEMDRAIGHICMVPEDDQTVPPVLIFSAKEAVYKACHPILSGNLWFTDFTIFDVRACGTFGWRLNTDPRIHGEGRYRITADGVMTCVALQNDHVLASHAAAQAPTVPVHTTEKEYA